MSTTQLLTRNLTQYSPQNRYFIRLILFVSILATSSSLFSQTVGVNERGDSIVVFNDGSWRYYDGDIDNKKLEVAEEIDVPEPQALEVSKKNKSKKSKSGKVKSKKTKAPKQKSKKQKTKKQKTKKNKGKSNKKKAKPKKASKSKKKSEGYAKSKKSKSKSKIKKPTKFIESQSQDYAEKAKKAAIKSQLRLRDYEEASFNLSLKEEELKSAYTSPNTTDSDIVALETKVRALREVAENAKLEYEMMKERSDFYDKLNSLPVEKRAKFLAKNNLENPDQPVVSTIDGFDDGFQDSEFSQLNDDTIDSDPKANDGNYQAVSVNSDLSTKDLKFRQKLRSTSNLYLNPPPEGCPEISVGYNEFTGKKKTSVAFENFFFNTPDQMRILLKKKEYLTCDGSLSKAGNIHFLDLKILVSSASAQRDYGFIEKGSRLTLKLLDGYSIVLFAVQSEQGELNNLEKTVTYTPRYIIEKGDLKLLEKDGIDKIRLVWMTGYEDYDIYNVDFLSNQIKCLLNN